MKVNNELRLTLLPALCYMELILRALLDPETLKGIDIASRLNCHYDGMQPPMGGYPAIMQFTDNVTHSTTYGNTFEEVRDKLEKMRKEFKGAKG